MGRVEEELREPVEDIARQYGVEVASMELMGQGRNQILRVTIDREEGVSIKDCENVSRELDALLDTTELIRGTYTLEVTSPGIDRPLTKVDDFLRRRGKVLRVVTKEIIDSRNVFTGRLRDVLDNRIILEVGNQERAIDLKNILKAKMEIEIP